MKSLSRWRRTAARPLDALVANLAAGLEGDADALHAARVASRRVRALVAILRESLGRRRYRKLVRRLRRITSLLGRVRELDVSLALIDDAAAANPRFVARMDAVRGALMAERQEALAEAARKGLPRTAAKVRERLSATLEAFEREKRDWNRAAADELVRRARRLQAAVNRAQISYDADRLHLSRVALKRFRYVVELASDGRGQPARRQLAVLRHAQDLLGRMHDLDVLVHRIRAAADTRAETVTDTLDKEARELHAEYLTRRPRLVAVIKQCKERFGASAAVTRRATGTAGAVRLHQRHHREVRSAVARNRASD